MKKKTIAVIVLMILVLPVLLLLLNFRLVVFNEPLYQKEFQKYDVYDTFSGEDINKVNNDVLLYFKNKQDSVDNDFFNEKEKQHLVDVKELIRLGILIFYVLSSVFVLLLLLLIIFNKNAKEIIKYLGISFICGGVLNLIFSFVLWLSIRLNFGNSFTKFHQLFFESGTWVFGAADKIISLYPEGFFYDMGYKIAIGTVASSVILLMVGVVMVYKQKDL